MGEVVVCGSREVLEDCVGAGRRGRGEVRMAGGRERLQGKGQRAG